MKRLLLILLLLTAFLAAETPTKLQSGINMDNFDHTVKPQDDFYRYVNGTWLKNTEIPADLPMYGSFMALYEESQNNLKAIIEEAAKLNNVKGSELQQVGDLYLSFMDTLQLEKLGISPLKKGNKKNKFPEKEK